MKKIRIVTRKSKLALEQTDLTIKFLRNQLTDTEFEIIPVTTTGDRQRDWSLEKKGGKGLFTKELELALINNDADIAIHSAKDLPTSFDKALAIAGYLPRESVNDVLVISESCKEPKVIASGSPRRRDQGKLLFPNTEWIEIRGNVETRLKKIVEGYADATILAAAGLNRLGLKSWPGLKFRELSTEEMVPATGQGAIALQCRNAEKIKFEYLLDKLTSNAVTIERIFLEACGGGCHAAYASHFQNDSLITFHEKFGRGEISFKGIELTDSAAVVKIIEDYLKK